MTTDRTTQECTIRTQLPVTLSMSGAEESLPVELTTLDEDMRTHRVGRQEMTEIGELVVYQGRVSAAACRDLNPSQTSFLMAFAHDAAQNPPTESTPDWKLITDGDDSWLSTWISVASSFGGPNGGGESTNPTPKPTSEKPKSSPVTALPQPEGDFCEYFEEFTDPGLGGGSFRVGAQVFTNEDGSKDRRVLINDVGIEPETVDALIAALVKARDMVTDKGSSTKEAAA